MISYEVLMGKGLKEFFFLLGGDWGRNRVNEEFLLFLGDFFGMDGLKEFRWSNLSEYYEFEKLIEILKGMFKDDDDDIDFILKILSVLWNMD